MKILKNTDFELYQHKQNNTLKFGLDLEYWNYDYSYYESKVTMPITVIYWESNPIGDTEYPIILADNYIQSENIWTIKNFYKILLKVIDAEKKPGKTYYPRGRHNYKYSYSKYHGDIFRWGCRRFSKKQLLYIKKTMEQEYSKKELGVSNGIK